MPSIPPPPFAKTAKPTPQNVAALDTWLEVITAYHPLTAGRPWLFYEHVDRFLGPWGASGYPMTYGYKYCHLFSQNRDLNADPAAAKWVQRTLILLQNELHTFILARFRNGTLGSLTAAELQEAAFNSHPRAYTEGGLTMVVLLAPDLVAAIAAIPKAEFTPLSPTFKASVKQVVDTTGIVLPQLIGNILALAAGPAHNQVMTVAAARDQARFLADRSLSSRLGQVRTLVQGGRCDHLDVLDRLRIALERTTFVDIGAAATAFDLVEDIERRMSYVNLRYQRETARDRTLRDIFAEFDENACTWRP